MSTGLELRQDLPRIQLPPIKSQALQSEDAVLQENGRSGDDECQTPTSDEHKIPAVLSCPPAPRKTKRIASYKRKLSEFEFFDIMNREEVESFFRSNCQVVAKRKCSCT